MWPSVHRYLLHARNAARRARGREKCAYFLCDAVPKLLTIMDVISRFVKNEFLFTECLPVACELTMPVILAYNFVAPCVPRRVSSLAGSGVSFPPLGHCRSRRTCAACVLGYNAGNVPPILFAHSQWLRSFWSAGHAVQRGSPKTKSFLRSSSRTTVRLAQIIGRHGRHA